MADNEDYMEIVQDDGRDTDKTTTTTTTEDNDYVEMSSFPVSENERRRRLCSVGGTTTAFETYSVPRPLAKPIAELSYGRTNQDRHYSNSAPKFNSVMDELNEIIKSRKPILRKTTDYNSQPSTATCDTTVSNNSGDGGSAFSNHARSLPMSERGKPLAQILEELNCKLNALVIDVHSQNGKIEDIRRACFYDEEDVVRPSCETDTMSYGISSMRPSYEQRFPVISPSLRCVLNTYTATMEKDDRTTGNAYGSLERKHVTVSSYERRTPQSGYARCLKENCCTRTQEKTNGNVNRPIEEERRPTTVSSYEHRFPSFYVQSTKPNDTRGAGIANRRSEEQPPATFDVVRQESASQPTKRSSVTRRLFSCVRPVKNV